MKNKCHNNQFTVFVNSCHVKETSIQMFARMLFISASGIILHFGTVFMNTFSTQQNILPCVFRGMYLLRVTARLFIVTYNFNGATIDTHTHTHTHTLTNAYVEFFDT